MHVSRLGAGLLAMMLLASCAGVQMGTSPGGQIIDGGVATGRLIRIGPGTRWVNVRNGETVRFESNGRTFGYRFSGVFAEEHDLRSIAPPGFIDRPVRVYVAPDVERLGGPSGRQ